MAKQFNKVSRCLTINTLCDWNCTYCIAETNMFSDKPQKPRPQDEVIFIEAIKFLNEVDPDKYGSITLSGGEPGLLPINKLKEIFHLCYNRGVNIDINSNGRIFNKIIELQPEEIDYTNVINTIDWHLVPNIKEVVEPSGINYKVFNSKLNVPRVVLKTQDDSSAGDPSKPNLNPIELINQTIFLFAQKYKIHIRPLIVVTKQDIQILEKFLIAFKFQVPLEVRVCEPNESGWNKHQVPGALDKLRIYKILQKDKNVSEESLEILDKIFKKEKRDVFDSDRTFKNI